MVIKLMMIMLVGLIFYGCAEVAPPPHVDNSSNVSTSAVPDNSSNVSVAPQPVFLSTHFGNLTAYYFAASGESTLIITPDNRSILYDAGSVADEEKLFLNVRRFGVERLDLLVLSRLEGDGVGGANYLAFRLKPNRTLSVRSTPNFAFPISSVEVDYSEPLGVADLAFVVPYDDGQGFGRGDDTVLLKISLGSVSFLFGGGCSILGCEYRLGGADLESDVFIAAKKGSCEANSLSFLLKIKPAIIASKTPPCPELVKNADSFKVPVLAVDKNTLVLTSDGSSVTYYFGS